MVPDVAAEEHVGVQPAEERDLRVRRGSSESGACMESACVVLRISGFSAQHCDVLDLPRAQPYALVSLRHISQSHAQAQALAYTRLQTHACSPAWQT